MQWNDSSQIKEEDSFVPLLLYIPSEYIQEGFYVKGTDMFFGHRSHQSFTKEQVDKWAYIPNEIF